MWLAFCLVLYLTSSHLLRKLIIRKGLTLPNELAKDQTQISRLSVMSAIHCVNGGYPKEIIDILISKVYKFITINIISTGVVRYLYDEGL